MESIIADASKEYTWNLHVMTLIKCKPDIRIRNRDKKLCQIVEICCTAEVNTMLEVSKKKNIYAELRKIPQYLNRTFNLDLH